ncbi:MAG: hypothetical protein ACYSUT_09720 [Planctomycetota bacterium]|jgi:hypothetical protein
MPDFLVKLASFGTAGVCVCAIFYCGVAIFKLPDKTPAWRVQLTKRYINACVFIAVISAISGGVNAYFNQNKIRVARQDANTSRNQYALLQKNYKTEMVRIEQEKMELINNLAMLTTQLENKGLEPAKIRDFAEIKKGVEGLYLKSPSDIHASPPD